MKLPRLNGSKNKNLKEHSSQHPGLDPETVTTGIFYRKYSDSHKYQKGPFKKINSPSFPPPPPSFTVSNWWSVAVPSVFYHSSVLFSVFGQQLSPHELNELSLREQKSDEDEEQTHSPHADVDRPEQPAVVTAEENLKPDY